MQQNKVVKINRKIKLINQIQKVIKKKTDEGLDLRDGLLMS